MSDNCQIVTKGVSFNVLDEDQKELLEHALKRKNFSAYIKRLIQRDIDNAFVPKGWTKVDTSITEEPSPDESLDEGLMGGLI